MNRTRLAAHCAFWLAICNLKKRAKRGIDSKCRVVDQSARRLSFSATRGTGTRGEIWQRRFYDFNVWMERKRIEKLRYMHRNPVKRELVSQPEHWAWSSFRAYAFGEPGPVRINDCQVLEMKVRHPTASEKGVHTHPFTPNAKG